MAFDKTVPLPWESRSLFIWPSCLLFLQEHVGDWAHPGLSKVDAVKTYFYPVVEGRSKQWRFVHHVLSHLFLLADRKLRYKYQSWRSSFKISTSHYEMKRVSDAIFVLWIPHYWKHGSAAAPWKWMTFKAELCFIFIRSQFVLWRVLLNENYDLPLWNQFSVP